MKKNLKKEGKKGNQDSRKEKWNNVEKNT
jgi:hypothetical protein